MMRNGNCKAMWQTNEVPLSTSFHVDTRNQFHGRAPFWNPDPCSGFSEQLHSPGAHHIIIGGRFKRVSDLVMSKNRATASLRRERLFSLCAVLCLPLPSRKNGRQNTRSFAALRADKTEETALQLIAKVWVALSVVALQVY